MNLALLRPLALLGLASSAAVVLLVARILYLGHWRQLYLAWNLFLAWIPLLLALVAGRAFHATPTRRIQGVVAGVAWLCFFPNAPYILTDCVHLLRSGSLFWVDLVLILLFALIGLVVGFCSLFLMQTAVARRHGWPAGWLFAAGVAALSGFGLYVGRFWRWNSWDVLFNPINVLADVAQWVLHLPTNPKLAVVPVLFATLIFGAYVSLYALTHLREASRPGEICLAKVRVRSGCAGRPPAA